MKLKTSVETPSVKISSSIEDIIEVNRRLASTREKVRIMELGSLGDLIPFPIAESIRRSLLKNRVKVKQLTNQRVFEPWTEVNNFVKECMDVRYVAEDVLPIHTETLIFDNTVAIYQVKPNVSVTIIEHAAFAAQQKALFDNFWNIAIPTAINVDGSTTLAVTIKRSPQEVYNYISNLANWPEFSDFAANFEKVTDNEYIAHTSQGNIKVVALFDREHLLLDTQCILPDGEVQTIPYRVVPNKDGAELMMTNFRPNRSSKADYEEQLYWIEVELKRVKEILEKDTKL
jgi:hypothetical protein